jgi:FAD/FMN-containing dehydrogenase
MSTYIDPGKDAAMLASTIKGQVLTASDPRFEEAASGVWNRLGPVERRPDIIVRAAEEDDVARAVRFAGQHGLKVAVRGGGHNWANPSLRRGGMMIDLSLLNQVVSVDTGARRAVAQPYVSNREIQARLNPLGLAYPSGHCPQVKMSGYLLSGGMSWNHGVWGPGTGSVEAIELVTAQGERILADKNHHSDYFWAARGAGPGFFGVALRYHLKLYELPRAITCSSYVYPLGEATTVARWLESLAPKLPPSVELTLFLLEAPEGMGGKLPPGDNGKACLVTATMFADTAHEAKETLGLLDTCPVIEKCVASEHPAPCTFEGLFDASGALWPEGMRNSVDALFSNAPLGELVEAVQGHITASPSPATLILFAVYTGPDGAPKLPEGASFSMTARYYGGPWTMWTDPGQDQANTAWHEACVTRLAPYTAGHYVSETNTTTHPEYVRRSYSEASWQRLQDLRRKHDPDGVFFDYFDALR